VQGDEDADEPFAWVFYLTLDGSTITQSKANPDRLVSTVVVKGNEGSHGNLGVDGVVAGRVFAIPASIGAYATSMRSIRISNPLEIVVPGRVVAFLVLLDEDVTSDADIEVAHEKVTRRVQDRFNEFLQDMSLNQIVIDAGQLMIGRPDLDLAGAATEICSAALRRIHRSAQRRARGLRDGRRDRRIQRHSAHREFLRPRRLHGELQVRARRARDAGVEPEHELPGSGP
jgi:hypothetical protein